MNTTTTITPETTINEIVAILPKVLPVLNGFGFDTCCGGALPLKVAVERHGLVLDTVMNAIRAVESN